MKCYHDMSEGFHDCPGDSCIVGYNSFGAECRFSEVNWLPKQIKAIASKINDLEFEKRGLEERLIQIEEDKSQ